MVFSCGDAQECIICSVYVMPSVVHTVFRHAIFGASRGSASCHRMMHKLENGKEFFVHGYCLLDEAWSIKPISIAFLSFL
jgi:hypothetical protein